MDPEMEILVKKLYELEKENARLREEKNTFRRALFGLWFALESVEWVATGFDGQCPWCKNHVNKGHDKDCIRQRALVKDGNQ